MQLSFTTIVLRNPVTGGKHYTIKDGAVVKETVGYISNGRAFRDTATDMADFASMLNKELRPGRDVLAYGVPCRPVPEDGLPVVRKLDVSVADISRSEDHFQWPDGPGILAADYDPRDGHDALSRDELWAQITSVVPAYADHDIVWACSSSSHIWHAGEEVSGLKGQRLYLGVEDATDIPRAADVLQKRLWLSGHGYIFISSSGSQLVRSTLDPCMYQASRLDYASGAVCGANLEQRRPDAFLISEGARLADTRALLPPLTADEEFAYYHRVNAAKAATQQAARGQRSTWAKDRVRKEAEAAGGTEREIADRATGLMVDGRYDELMRVSDGDRAVLSFAHLVRLNSGKTVTVEEILATPADYENVVCSDPLEHEYRGYAATAKIYPRCRRISSWAHGVQRIFTLGTPEEWRLYQVGKAEKLAKLLKEPK